MVTARQTVQTAARKARHQTAVVEYREDSRWWLMLNDGTVQEYDSASYALQAVKQHARRGNRGVTLTTVEWRNVPDGWKPPSQ